MKHALTCLLILLSLSLNAQTRSWGDQGDGTYRNPVLNAESATLT